MADLDTFINGLPKAELHVHLEGTLEPEMMLALAERNGIATPYATAEEARAAYEFENLQSFLDIYYRGCDALRTPEDFHDLAAAYLARARADNVRHVEPFFDPQAHTGRGIAFATMFEGIAAAFEEAEREHGLTSHLILCFLRHLSEDAAFATLQEAEPYLGRIVGVGLDSSELSNPPSKFERVFAAARERGLRLVAHAGEEGPAAYVREALHLLHVERVDHGNKSLDDIDLVAELVERRIPLTVCPLSNVRLRNVDRIEVHPFKQMLELGLNASIHSDDPPYFGGYINDNYRALAHGLGLTADDVVTAARNSFRSAFIEPDHRRRLIDELEAYAERAAPG